MSWSAESFAGPAKDFVFVVSAPNPRPTGREGQVLDDIEASLPGVIHAFGDQHVSVTAYGHTNDTEGRAGDVLAISVSGIEPLVGEALEQHEAAKLPPAEEID